MSLFYQQKRDWEVFYESCNHYTNFLAFAILLFVTEKIPLGLTSMVVCIGLVVTGVLSVGDAFSGFINSNVILFVAMFIVGGALFETGMANEIGSLVTKFAKQSEV